MVTVLSGIKIPPQTNGLTSSKEFVKTAIGVWRHVPSFAIVIVLTLFGCARRPPSKSEFRAITAEVVAAAQNASAHKAQVTIRPEIHPSGNRSLSGNGTDHIYLTLAGASQLAPFRQSLRRIARHHKLAMTEGSSGGMIEFDLAFRGNRTHSIHVITPLAARQPVLRASSAPKLAIIIDDLGYDRASAEDLLALSFPLTVSVIPHLPLSGEVAEEAYRRGDQVLLHLPMQSESHDVKHEDVELSAGMNSKQVASALAGMLETVPHAVGVNNHQGSRATSDPKLMQELMPDLRARNLFFIDSRTTAATVAYRTAQRFGVRAASRKVFLDDTPSRDAILAQLKLAASDAARDGYAIAIGHPHPETIAALADDVPRLESQGILLVFASEVVH